MTNEPEIMRHGRLDSTNTRALVLMDTLPSSCLITADEQTAGRGRRGRSWVSPPGRNIYATWALKDDRVPVFAVTWVLSLAALDCLRRAASGLDLWLKWPNDIYCGRKKISGILCETRMSAQNKVLGVAAGLGVNVNMRADELVMAGAPATSIFNETGVEADVPAMVAALAESIGARHAEAVSIGAARLRERWKAENRLLGREVEVVTERGVVEGVFEDVGETGELILLSGGARTVFHSGDVSIGKNFRF